MPKQWVLFPALAPLVLDEALVVVAQLVVLSCLAFIVDVFGVLYSRLAAQVTVIVFHEIAGVFARIVPLPPATTLR